MRRRGEITVFLSLVLVLLLSFFLALFQSARVQFAKSTARDLSYMAAESLFGEYQTDLLEDYEILAVDALFGNGGSVEDNLSAHRREFLSYHLDMKKELAGFDTPVSFGLEEESADIEAIRLLTDDNGKAARTQISGYMKDKYGITFAEELFASLGGADAIRNQEIVYESNLEDNRRQIESLEQEKEESGVETDNELEKGNPLDEVEELRASSILHLLIEDESTISDKKLADINALPSNRSLKQGYGSLTSVNTEETVLDQILFREFLLQRLGSFSAGMEEANEKALQYEMEYLIVGNDSDIRNLEGIAGRLLLIREAVNFAYLCTDGEKKAEAEALAITLTGYFGIPPLITATKWALLLAWAFAESVLDVRTLFAGGRVPLFKTEASFETGLTEIADIATGQFRVRKQKDEGLSYEDSLRVMLYLGNVDVQTMRFLDLAEREIRNKGKADGFAVDHCVVGVRFACRFSVPQGKSYDFPVEYAYR